MIQWSDTFADNAKINGKLSKFYRRLNNCCNPRLDRRNKAKTTHTFVSRTFLNIPRSQYLTESFVSFSGFHELNGLDPAAADRTRIGVFHARIASIDSLYLWACVWFRPLWHYDEILSYTSRLADRVGGFNANSYEVTVFWRVPFRSDRRTFDS